MWCRFPVRPRCWPRWPLRVSLLIVFCLKGFVPAKGAPRQQAIERLAALSVTSIIYEAPHRVLSFLETLKGLVEKDREITLCRELTKQFETIRRGPW